MAGVALATAEVFGSVKKIKFVWTTASSSSGAATGTTTEAFNGKVEQLVTVPGASAAAPSASYDVTVVDQDSVDILAGAGANRHTANTEQVIATSLGVIANDTMTVNIAAAGSSNGGTVYVYVR